MNERIGDDGGESGHPPDLEIMLSESELAAAVGDRAGVRRSETGVATVDERDQGPPECALNESKLMTESRLAKHP